jgi:hypothetical protein
MVLEKELEGVEETAQPSGDERTFPFLLQLDEWEQSQDYIFQHPEVWKKVNPHIGITVQRDYYQMEIEKSRIDGPDKEVEVLSKLFNTFQTGKVREWLSPDDIRPLQIDRRIDDCKYDEGWIVFCGLDFSKGDDLNGVSYLAYNTERGEFVRVEQKYQDKQVQINVVSKLKEMGLPMSDDYLYDTFDVEKPDDYDARKAAIEAERAAAEERARELALRLNEGGRGAEPTAEERRTFLDRFRSFFGLAPQDGANGEPLPFL